MRRPVTVAAALLLTACVGPPPNQAPTGPMLVIDVRNASEREVDVGYEFSGPVMNGTGATLAPPCTRQPVPAGEVEGGSSYAVQVEGKTVVEATVPAAAPDGSSIVVGILVGSDGAIEVLPPSLVEVPELDTSTVPGCG